jgi:CO/xanthine dehydrogenase FAD-binding subunit
MSILLEPVAFHEGKKRLVILANTTLDEVLACDDCPAYLRAALPANWQMRNETSLARSLIASGPQQRWVAALLACGAWILAGDAQEIPLETYLQTIPAPRAEALLLPVEVPGRRYGDAFVSLTPAGDPLVAAAAVVDLPGGKVERAHIAVSGAWGSEGVQLAKAGDLLLGKPFEAILIQKTAAAVEKESNPRSDYRASADYRRAMAGVTVRRALEACLKGA